MKDVIAHCSYHLVHISCTSVNRYRPRLTDRVVSLRKWMLDKYVAVYIMHKEPTCLGGIKLKYELSKLVGQF